MRKGEESAQRRLEAMMACLESMLRHRQAHPTARSEELYYRLMLDYWGRVLRAREEGKVLAAVSTLMPVEVLHPFDRMVPFALESFAECSMVLLGDFAECYAEAAAGGIKVEVCSPHRSLIGMYRRGVVPRPDLVLWTSMVCDNTAKVGYAPADHFGAPTYLFDLPYRATEREVAYFASQLAQGIRFLEEQTGQRMDPERLRQVVELSEEGVKLQREISQLRRAIPAPTRSRSFLHWMFAEMLWAGTPEAVAFYRQVRDELQESVTAGQGAIPHEHYRILTLFLPPVYDWKLMDWMEREYGAVSVIEPYSCWGPGEMDPERPLESLARKSFYRDVCRQMGGPGELFVRDAVQLARDYQADGAIYFAHIGCRQACALIATVKEALRQELGIPMVVLDNDIADPSFMPAEELRGKLEEFFEVLEARR